MRVVDLAGAIGGILSVLVYVGYVLREAVRQAPERRAEEAAREHFTRYGTWPEES